MWEVDQDNVTMLSLTMKLNWWYVKGVRGQWTMREEHDETVCEKVDSARSCDDGY